MTQHGPFQKNFTIRNRQNQSLWMLSSQVLAPVHLTKDECMCPWYTLSRLGLLDLHRVEGGAPGHTCACMFLPTALANLLDVFVLHAGGNVTGVTFQSTRCPWQLLLGEIWVGSGPGASSSIPHSMTGSGLLAPFIPSLWTYHPFQMTQI